MGGRSPTGPQVHCREARLGTCWDRSPDTCSPSGDLTCKGQDVPRLVLALPGGSGRKALDEASAHCEILVLASPVVRTKRARDLSSSLRSPWNILEQVAGGRCSSSSTLGAPSTSQSQGERAEGGPCGDQRETRASTSSSSTPGGPVSGWTGLRQPLPCTGEAEAGEGRTWIPGLEAAGWGGGEAVQHRPPPGERCPRRTLFSAHVQEPLNQK